MSEPNSSNALPVPVDSGDRPASPPTRFKDVLAALLTWFAADTVAGLVILAAAASVLVRSGLPLKEAIRLLPGDFTFVVTTVTVSSLIALTIIWRWSKRSCPKPFAAFFAPVPHRKVIWAALCGFALMAAELALETYLKRGLGLPLPISESESAIHPKTALQLLIVLPALAVIVPFFEEVVFRGYILGWLKRTTPVWVAILVSAAVFAAAHGLYAGRGGLSGWVGTGEIFVTGVLLAWWASRTNSLRPGYVLHAVVNATSFCLAFFFPGLYP